MRGPSQLFRDSRVRTYGTYLLLFAAVVVGLGAAEAMGLSEGAIGWAFLLLTLGLFVLVGANTRTARIAEYYVAGRRVPAVFNGMATAADWMSAASFISLAGTIYLLGRDGLAYVMGWTGGFVLLAVLLAPYLRKFGQYTIPDFLGARYGGHLARLVGVVAAVVASFVHLIAQVTGVGIITSRFLGLDFAVGVLVGLAAILVCSMLGGMKAVTWAQVAQYLIVITAYLVPVIVLSYRHTGVPIPAAMYGQVLQQVEAREGEIGAAPRTSASGERAPERAAEAGPAPASLLRPFVASDRKNVLALALCLMLGTAGMPHLLMRYYTVPSVREARSSVGWSLLFIVVLYLAAPAYAAFARWEVLSSVVGAKFAELPAWIAHWGRLGLVALRDANADGIVQLSELRIGADAIVLATPEMARLPFVISGLVAAGGLAAALSTADGLLLTIGNALSHDLYFKVLAPAASVRRRLAVARALLVVTAGLAAWAATLTLASIVELVAWAFSIAAAALFPALVMGVWDKRANQAGAVAGMLAGLAITVVYLVGSRFHGLSWWGIQPVAAGIFGAPLGLATIYLVSRLTKAPRAELQELVESVRFPRGAAAAGPPD